MTASGIDTDTLEDVRSSETSLVAERDDADRLDASTAERQTIDIPTAARMLGCSRGLAYKMARDGRLPVIQLSARRMVVPLPALMRMLAGTTEDDDPPDDGTAP